MDLEVTDSEVAVTLDLDGSSTKTDLDLELPIKNTLNADVNMKVRMSATAKKSITQPAATDSIDGDAMLGW